MDGNGRMGRFLMNLTTGSGAYPWTIVPLERASVPGDIKPFARFPAELPGGGAETKRT